MKSSRRARDPRDELVQRHEPPLDHLVGIGVVAPRRPPSRAGGRARSRPGRRARRGSGSTPAGRAPRSRSPAPRTSRRRAASAMASPGRGWPHAQFVHSPPEWYLPSARRCSSSSPAALKANTENARCSAPVRWTSSFSPSPTSASDSSISTTCLDTPETLSPVSGARRALELSCAASSPSVLLAFAPAAAHASENLTHVKNLNYAPANGGTPNYGTDIEFATLNGREYALAGSYNNGMQIVDITDPQNAQIAAVYDCGVSQGDVQVFRQEDLPGRTFATYTSDTFGDGTSTCYRRGRGARLRRPQARRHRPQRHVHRRADRPAGAEDRLLRRVHAGLAQHDRAPERQLPLQLELGPDHVDPAGDRGRRHLRA